MVGFRGDGQGAEAPRRGRARRGKQGAGEGEEQESQEAGYKPTKKKTTTTTAKQGETGKTRDSGHYHCTTCTPVRLYALYACPPPPVTNYVSLKSKNRIGSYNKLIGYRAASDYWEISIGQCM